jgi:hypothetical protein
MKGFWEDGGGDLVFLLDFFFFFFFSVLRTKLWALHLLAKRSSTDLNPQPSDLVFDLPESLIKIQNN